MFILHRCSMKDWTLWIYLRTWVYSFAALSYVFTGSFIYTLLLTLFAELLQTLAYYYPVHDVVEQKYSDRNRRLLHVDIAISALLAVVASFFIVLLEYTFACVSFIGDTRAFGYVILYLLLCGMRVCLLIDGMFGFVSFCFMVCVGVVFIVMLTDTNFYSDTRTMTIVSTYVFGTWFFAVLYFLCLWLVRTRKSAGQRTAHSSGWEYLFFALHAIVMTVVFVVERGHHSERSFSYYMHH